MSQRQGIRVTCRFRPMNRNERNQENNHVCVKISDCHRAVQVVHPERPQMPRMFYFDTIYGPGVAQSDVYKYTGEPLVQAMKDGFNSTIFAYGQTGSGKTFSMMGVLGTENRGLQPRIIEETFDYIQNLPADDPNQYQVAIMMSEIYLEKVRDLFNPINDNMKIRESPGEGVYIDGAVAVDCATTQEVLDAMENGFMGRATSATKMNSESSRSHCVTILRVIKTSTEDGSRIVSKIKMVDLAGSEKTSKTEAVGKRLDEAKCINQSLSALSSVLEALTTKGKGDFIPFRNSKLTRLLQDALGGNSKTSLAICASPCSYNVEETISTLQFGTRAKKVKCHAKIVQDLTPAQMKKAMKGMEAEIAALKSKNELLTLQKEALMSFLTQKKFNADAVIADVKLPAEGEEDDLENQNFAFNKKVSGAVYEINKATGAVLAGEAFTEAISVGAKSAMRKKRDEELQRELDEQAELVASLIRKGDYAGVGTLIGAKLGVSNQSGFDEDTVLDLRAELRGTEAFNEQLEDERESLQDRIDDLNHELAQVKAHLAEHRFYKQKVLFLEREQQMQINHIKKNGGGFSMMSEETQDDGIDMSVFDGIPDEARRQVENLRKMLRQKDSKIRHMKENGDADMSQAFADLLNGSDGARAVALKKILSTQKSLQQKLAGSQHEMEKAKRVASMLAKQNEMNGQLRSNWRKQLKQMEEAVLLCSTIHKRDIVRYKSTIQDRDATIMKLKVFLSKQNRIKQQRTIGSRVSNVIGGMRGGMKGGRIVKPTAGVKPIRKKRRPSRVQPAQGQVGVAQAS